MNIKYTVYDIKSMLKLMLVKLTTHLFLSCVFKVLSCLAAKHFLFVLTEFIWISAATVTQPRGRASSDLRPHKLYARFNHNCLHTVIQHTSPLSARLRIYLYPSGRVSHCHCTLWYSVECQRHRGAAGSPVVSQVGYLWPPATSTSLFHGWQKECQSSSSSGDLWPAAAFAAHGPHSWVSDVGSL